MGAGDLGPCPEHQGGGQSKVIVGETTALVTEHDEAADAVTDPHRHGQQALDLEVGRDVAHEPHQPGLVMADELPARLDRSDQRACTARSVDGLRAQAIEAEAGWLRHKLLAVCRDQVADGERRSDLARDAGCERADVARLGGLGV